MNPDVIQAKQNVKRETTIAIVWAGGMLVLTIGAVVAHRLGYIGHDTVMRLCFVPIGLWMVWVGNRLPKAFVKDAQARRAQRLSAWIVPNAHRPA